MDRKITSAQFASEIAGNHVTLGTYNDGYHDCAVIKAEYRGKWRYFDCDADLVTWEEVSRDEALRRLA